MLITDRVADHPTPRMRAYLMCVTGTDDLARWPTEKHDAFKAEFVRQHPTGNLSDFVGWLRMKAEDYRSYL